MVWLPGILPTVVGFTLWSAGFIALYAVQALGCQYGWGEIELLGTTLHRVVMIAVYAATLLAALFLVWDSRGRNSGQAAPRALLGWVGHTLNLAALAASVFVFSVIFGTSACI